MAFSKTPQAQLFGKDLRNLAQGKDVQFTLFYLFQFLLADAELFLQYVDCSMPRFAH